MTHPPTLARYQQVLKPWVDQAMNYAVRIHPEIITGFRLDKTPA